MVSCQILVLKVVGSKPAGNIMCLAKLLWSVGNNWSILDIGISNIDLVRYWNGSWCRYWNYSDIGMKGFSPTFFVPISEWEMSLSDVGYCRHKGRCRCPLMLDIHGFYVYLIPHSPSLICSHLESVCKQSFSCLELHKVLSFPNFTQSFSYLESLRVLSSPDIPQSYSYLD